MKSLREIIPKNISDLRKQHNFTQMDLAKKINYSDKAVSRWENGDVLPDIETLGALADVFGVPLSDMLKEHENNVKSVRRVRSEVLSQILLVFEIWAIICVAYSYINVAYGRNFWEIFLIGVPMSAIILFFYNSKKNNVVSFVYGTVFIWSLLTCVFLYLLPVVTWYLFIIGAPVQGIFIVKYLFKFNRKDIRKIRGSKK